jgi:hypothetical protein
MIDFRDKSVQPILTRQLTENPRLEVAAEGRGSEFGALQRKDFPNYCLFQVLLPGAASQQGGSYARRRSCLRFQQGE